MIVVVEISHQISLYLQEFLSHTQVLLSQIQIAHPLLFVCVCVWKSLSHVWLFGPHGLYSPGILQARILEWVAIPFSRRSSQPRDQTQVSHISGRFFTSWATREAQEYWSEYPIPSPADLPDPGIEPGSLALQAGSLLLSHKAVVAVDTL